MNDFSEFKIETKKDSPQDEYLRSMTATEDSGIFQSHLAWVWTIAWIAGVIGAIAGLCFSVVAFFTAEDLKSREIRGIFFAPVFCGVVASGMVFGTALLFAPSRFFSCTEGLIYLDMIGTRSVIAARIVILVFLLIGCAVGTVFILGALQMAGYIDPPLQRG